MCLLCVGGQWLHGWHVQSLLALRVCGAARAFSAAPDACVCELPCCVAARAALRPGDGWKGQLIRVDGWMCVCVLCDDGLVVDGYMVGAFKVYWLCWRGAVRAFCTVPDTCVHVEAPVRVAARVALRSGVGRARRVVGSIMRWGYSFSRSEGGLGSLSSLCSVKGLSVLHLVAPQTFKGRPRVKCARCIGGIVWWYSYSGGMASAAARAAFGCLSAPRVLNALRGLPTAVQPMFIWAVVCSCAARRVLTCRPPRAGGGCAVSASVAAGAMVQLVLNGGSARLCSALSPRGRGCMCKRRRRGQPWRLLLAARA